MKATMNIGIDSFFTDTRVRICLANCIHLNRDHNCELKEIEINTSGVCLNFEGIKNESV